MATRRWVTSPDVKEESKGIVPSGGEHDEPRAAILATFVSVSMNMILMFIYVGYMPALYSAQGIDMMTFGYIQSTFGFIQMCTTPLLGWLADRIGPRQVLLMCLFSCSLAHVTMGLASTPSMLIMSRTASVIMDAGPVCQMLLIQLVAESARGRYLSRSMLPMGIGMILGPTIGGAMAARLGPQKPLFIGSAFGMLAIFLVFTFIPGGTQKKIPGDKKEESKGWQHYSRLVTKRPVPILLIQRLLTMLPAMTFMMNFPIAGATYYKLDPQSNGLMVSSFGAMNLLNNAIVLPYLSTKFNEDALLRVAPLASVFAYFFMGQSSTALQLVVLMYPLSLGFGLAETISTVKLTKAVDDTDSSMILGIAQMVFHLARMLAPTLGGIMLHYFGWPAIGSFGLLISILSATLAFFYN